MLKQSKLNQFFIAAVLLLVFGASSVMAQDQDTERRFWPPNYRPAATAAKTTKPATRPAYKRTSPALEKGAITTAAERNSVVGITVWRLKPYEDIASTKPKEDIARILVTRKGKKSDFAAERVEASTAFTKGQMLRLSIEVPRSGYIYVIDREQYEDGSVSAPYLVYPLNAVQDDNKVAAGRVIEIPNGGDEPFFEVNPLKQENPKRQTAEMLTVLVTPTPLTGLPKATRDDEGNYQPIELPQSEVEKWEKLWGTQVEQLELDGGAGQTYTRSEQVAGTDKKKRLTSDDPPPQTLFRVASKPGKPLLVKLPLKIAK